MNYTRRTTRPDGLHYRETRKHIGGSRGRGRRGRGGGLMRAVSFLLGAAAIAWGVFWVFRH